MVDMTSLENAEFKEAFDEFDKVDIESKLQIYKKPYDLCYSGW